MFEPLHPEDIEEKIQLNLKKNHTLTSLKDALEMELFKIERAILNTENNLFGSRIQVQNLKEQIAYLDKRIAGRTDLALIEKVKNLIAEKKI